MRLIVKTFGQLTTVMSTHSTKYHEFLPPQHQNCRAHKFTVAVMRKKKSKNPYIKAYNIDDFVNSFRLVGVFSVAVHIIHVALYPYVYLY